MLFRACGLHQQTLLYAVAGFFRLMFFFLNITELVSRETLVNNHQSAI